jgi:hypothetical protein
MGPDVTAVDRLEMDGWLQNSRGINIIDIKKQVNINSINTQKAKLKLKQQNT